MTMPKEYIECEAMGMIEDIAKAVLIVVSFAFLYFCFHMEDLL